MQFLLRLTWNSNIAGVNQVRFSVPFVAAIAQGFQTCCNFSATKNASSCCDKNRLCKGALEGYFTCTVIDLFISLLHPQSFKENFELKGVAYQLVFMVLLKEKGQYEAKRNTFMGMA